MVSLLTGYRSITDYDQNSFALISFSLRHSLVSRRMIGESSSGLSQQIDQELVKILRKLLNFGESDSASGITGIDESEKKTREGDSVWGRFELP